MGILPAEWSDLGVVALSTALFYVLVLISMRLAGRRTLTEMSAFDWVVTVAIGSMIANTGLNSQVSVAEGTVGLASLLLMQTVFALTRRASRRAQQLVDFSPVVVISDGQVSAESLKRLQMTREDLMEKLRSGGHLRLDEIRFAIIEPTGELTVVPSGRELDAATDAALGRVIENHQDEG